MAGKTDNSAAFDGRSGINRDFNTKTYQEPALNAIKRLGGVSVDSLMTELGITNRRLALAVISSLEAGGHIRISGGLWQLK